uniref:Major facilitator superfamily (MFS) profile domain-containing protein n=1 Tax=Coccidioides posadasii RMSCC 3488 TaxID=454284 RepID=A0A0J6ETI8_COCPO|nr:hypothetical protein CPAG_00180 [Coccidioides posadasii RMSCC 3488]
MSGRAEHPFVYIITSQWNGRPIPSPTNQMALARSSLARVDDAMTLPRRVRVPRLVERHRASCFAGRPKANKQGPGVSNALVNADSATNGLAVSSIIPRTTKKSGSFWAIFPALCLTTFLSSLDTSILSTALPTISKELNSGTMYIWITNAYLFSSTVVQPLFGQTSNIFGRRSLMILSVVFFALGSGLAGGANGNTMLIVGRTVQGIGGGGIGTLVDIIISDLVPMRERGKYVALMAAIWAFGTVIGPVLGGALAQHVSWRWIFYINLPLSAASLFLLYFFLKVSHPRGENIFKRLSRVDFLGNGILVAAVVSILLSLTWAGTVYPWSSWRIITPLTVGFRSLAPSTMSGLYVLPITAAITPLGILTGILIAATGKYRAFHFLGFALMSVGVGLFSTLDNQSSTGHWVGFQFLFGSGAGMIFSSTLPPIQASVREADMATATATWSFMRSFGSVWGIAIPTAIFNDKIESILGRINDPSLRVELSNGGAYGLASAGLSRTLGSNRKLLSEVIGVYVNGLRFTWLLAIPFAVAGFLMCFPIHYRHT